MVISFGSRLMTFHFAIIKCENECTHFHGKGARGNYHIVRSRAKLRPVDVVVATHRTGYFLISIKESANPIIIRLNMCSVNGRIDVVAKNIYVRKYGACDDH